MDENDKSKKYILRIQRKIQVILFFCSQGWKYFLNIIEKNKTQLSKFETFKTIKKRNFYIENVIKLKNRFQSGKMLAMYMKG